MLGKEDCGEAAPWAMPMGRTRTAELGINRELREGVLEREGPLKAEGTGLLLPLPPPCRAMELACCSLNKAPAGLLMAAWEVSPGEGLGLGAAGATGNPPTPCMLGVERPEVREDIPEGV